MSLKAAVITAEGKKGRAKSLPEELFDGTVHKPALYQTVKAQRANLRQGDAATKKRGEVAGGKRKPWRQKGTGRARQGSTRSPHWRGGGIVFGPTGNENHTQKVPRKVKALARRSAFNKHALNDAVSVIERFDVAAPKTKQIIELLAKIGLGEQKILILTAGPNENVFRSARNLQNVQVLPFREASAYEVLNARQVLIEAQALRPAEEVVNA